MAKVLIVVERFYPEGFLVNDLAAEWKRQGHEVEILTQVPSYPIDRIYDGYRNKMYQTTREFNDIPIHRVSTVFGYNSSLFRKIFNYLHFAFLTSLWALWNGRKFDRVFIYHTAALTMASAAVPLRWIWRKPITIWTQDLWPDAVWGFGFKRTKLKEKMLDGFVRFIYARCSRISVSSRGYVRRIKELTGRDAEWIPQWEPMDMEVPQKAKDGNVIFMFAGNMGVPQNLDRVIEGFMRAELHDSELWLVGGGAMAESLEEKYGGAKGLRFCGRHPRTAMSEWYAKADVLIISLMDQYSLTLPGKFQTYVKVGKPILGIVNGETREMIEEFKIGLVADPGNVDDIISAFRRMYEAHMSGEGTTFGKRAKQLSDSMFDRETLIGRLWGANEENDDKK